MLADIAQLEKRVKDQEEQIQKQENENLIIIQMSSLLLADIAQSLREDGEFYRAIVRIQQ